MNWLEIHETDDNYVYAHEEYCGGEKVGVLPFRRTPLGTEFLVHMETTPCWREANGDPEEFFYNSITGGAEAWSPDIQAINELYEEGGYEVGQNDMFSLGDMFLSKAMDTIFSCYCVDLTDREVSEGGGKGDGSEREKGEWCEWVSEETLLRKSVDGLLLAMLYRFKMVRQEFYGE